MGQSRRVNSFSLARLAVALIVAVLHAGAALPEGNSGLAAKHPRDKGLAGDPAVVLAEDFESGKSPIWGNDGPT